MLLARKVADLIELQEFGVVVSLPPDDFSIHDAFSAALAEQRGASDPIKMFDQLPDHLVRVQTFDQVRELQERFGNLHTLLVQPVEELSRAGILVPPGFQDRFVKERQQLSRMFSRSEVPPDSERTGDHSASEQSAPRAEARSVRQT